MADLTLTPVAQNIKPMPSMSLGEMVDLARGVQAYKQTEQLNPLALQQQQQATQSSGIALSLEQQKERERLGMTEFLRTPENYQTNGRIDLDKLNAAATKIAPLTGADYVEKFTTLGKAQTEAIQAKQNLDQDTLNRLGSRLRALGEVGVKEKGAYIAEMENFAIERKDNPDVRRLVDNYKTIWTDIPSGDHLPSFAIRGAQTLLSPTEQQTAFAPVAGTVNTGAATFPTVTTPSVGGRQPTVAVGQQPLVTAQVPPQSRTVFSGNYDINNQPIFFSYGVNGEFLGQFAGSGALPPTQAAPLQPVAGAPRQTPPQPTRQAPQPVAAPSAIAPVARLPAGETPQTLAQANELRTVAANQAREAPMQTFNNNKIIELADKTLTGKGADFIGSLSGGYAALPFTTDNASNLNQLGHYMALQTSSLSQSSGLGGTDAARSIAGEISGTTQWTPDAIKSTARVNRALATSTSLFNQGIDNAFKRTGNPFAARDFQNQWSQTVDINAIRLYDAVKNKDAEGIRSLVNELGGANSQRYKDTRAKLDAMNRLLGTK